MAASALSARSIVLAQDAEPPVLVKVKELAARHLLLKIKNLPPAVLAYTLDPQHNPRPASLGAADKSQAKGTFDLPGSITEIVSVDPQSDTPQIG